MDVIPNLKALSEQLAQIADRFLGVDHGVSVRAITAHATVAILKYRLQTIDTTLVSTIADVGLVW